MPMPVPMRVPAEEADEQLAERLHILRAQRRHRLGHGGRVGAVAGVELAAVVRGDDGRARIVLLGGLRRVELLEHRQHRRGARLQVVDHAEDPRVARRRALVRLVDRAALGPVLDDEGQLPRARVDEHVRAQQPRVAQREPVAHADVALEAARLVLEGDDGHARLRPRVHRLHAARALHHLRHRLHELPLPLQRHLGVVLLGRHQREVEVGPLARQPGDARAWVSRRPARGHARGACSSMPCTHTLLASPETLEPKG